jgi:hypothetical protein
MKAFLRIKFNRNVMSPEDRSLLHMMRDIHFLPQPLAEPDLLSYMLLQEYFGILDPINDDELDLLKKLLLDRLDHDLTPEQMKMLKLLEKKFRLSNPTRHYKDLDPSEELEMDELNRLKNENNGVLTEIQLNRLKELEDKAGIVTEKPESKSSTPVKNKTRKQDTMGQRKIHMDTHNIVKDDADDDGRPESESGFDSEEFEEEMEEENEESRMQREQELELKA